MSFPTHLTYLKDKEVAWFNPCWGYVGFWKEIKKLQDRKGVKFQTAWHDREMKKAKEIFVSSIVALSMKAQTKEGWWITKPRQDPPDGLIGKVSTGEGVRNTMYVRELEIVEHLEGSIVETLEKKLTNKSYEPNTILVCFVNDSDSFDLESLAKEVGVKNFSLKHIFLVFFSLPGLSSDLMGSLSQTVLGSLVRVNLVQLAPTFAFLEIDAEELCVPFIEGREAAWIIPDNKKGKSGLRRVTIDTPPKLF